MSVSMIIALVIGAIVAITLGLLLSRLDRGMHDDSTEQTPTNDGDKKNDDENKKPKRK